MERRIDLAEISDGKLYGAEDMVKADCGDCEAALPAVRAWGIPFCWILMISAACQRGLKKALRS